MDRGEPRAGNPSTTTLVEGVNKGLGTDRQKECAAPIRLRHDSIVEPQQNGSQIVVPVAISEEQFEFEGAPVTVVKVERSGGHIEPMVPLTEIADRIGYEKNKLWELYNRNKDALGEFASVTVTVTELSDGRRQSREQLCFTRDGFVGLLMKVNTSRIKNPAKRDRILRFQKWGIETLGKLLAGELAAIPPRMTAALQQYGARLEVIEAAQTVIEKELAVISPGIVTVLQQQNTRIETMEGVLEQMQRRLTTPKKKTKSKSKTKSKTKSKEITRRRPSCTRGIGVSMSEDFAREFDEKIAQTSIFENRSQGIVYAMKQLIKQIDTGTLTITIDERQKRSQ